MPYINRDGKIVEITQAEFDSFTAAQPSGSLTQPATGTVVNSNTAVTPVLTPNTATAIPNVPFTQTNVTVYTNTGPVTSNTVPSAISTLSPGEVIVYGDSTSVSPTTDPQASTLQSQIAAVNEASTQIDASPAPVNPTLDQQIAAVDAAQQADTVAASDINTSATPVNSGPTRQVFDDGSVLYTNADGSVQASDAPDANLGSGTSADGASALSNIQGLVKNAQQQQTIAEQRKQINNGDWRVRLRLAPQADYLYKAAQPGILQPLKVTDGIIFPYTPAINTNYRANYTPYDLTHSNYRGYWYQNSYVDSISLTAMFTAQDTNDANYLLAVIHFLRSATKMFYGSKDPNRGSPPPLVYLSGLGDYQFREHSCVISNFAYNLPADVDYIRAGSPNNAGLNFNNIRDRQNVATNTIFGSINRLAAAFLTKGGITTPPAPPTLGLTRPTYVPTKIEIQLTLLPVQSRNQVSKQFNMQDFANGNLLKGGFW